jgi:hypothetical protein
MQRVNQWNLDFMEQSEQGDRYHFVIWFWDFDWLVFVHLYYIKMVWMDHFENWTDYFHIAQKIVEGKGCTKRGNGNWE